MRRVGIEKGFAPRRHAVSGWPERALGWEALAPRGCPGVKDLRDGGPHAEPGWDHVETDWRICLRWSGSRNAITAGHSQWVLPCLRLSGWSWR